jgi:hypothetical protein
VNNVFIYYLGDVGEPGLGGGYSQPALKGPTGMYVIRKRERRKIFIL